MYQTVEWALLSQRPKQRLGMLERNGTLARIYPEVASMFGFGGGETGHKDLWPHTKTVVAQTQPRAALRWAALFHDVGKVATFSRERGKVTFHGHEFQSAALFNRAALRTGLPEALRRHVRFLVRNLGLVESYSSRWTDSAVRRLHRQVGQRFEDLLSLARADITTKNPNKRARYLAALDELEQRATALARQDAELPLLPKGLGAELMRAFELGPGPHIGELKARLEQAVLRGELPARAEPEHYLAFLSGRPS